MSTYVFVPGMGCGSWAWQPVAAQIASSGHQVLPLTMPGLRYDRPDSGSTLADAVEYVVDRIERDTEGPVSLVAHSWGGYPATGAAVALGGGRVRELIYYSAVVPERGVSMAGENEGYAASIDAALAVGPTVPLPFEAVAIQMMQDESEQTQRLVHSLMVDTPARYLTDEPDFPSVADLGISARYLLSENDQCLARPGAEFAARIGLTAENVPGSHMALVTNPNPIAAAILTTAVPTTNPTQE